MRKHMLITIIYKNGRNRQNLVLGLHVQDGRLCYLLDQQINDLRLPSVSIPLENIDRYTVELVEFDGWDIPEELRANVPNWENIVELMDDDLRNDIVSETMGYLTQREFLEQYKDLHLIRYGEEFVY